MAATARILRLVDSGDEQLARAVFGDHRVNAVMLNAGWPPSLAGAGTDPATWDDYIAAAHSHDEAQARIGDAVRAGVDMAAVMAVGCRLRYLESAPYSATARRSSAS